MAGRRNGNSRSPHPRTKYRSRRSSSRSLSRSPVREVSRSPSPGLKRPRRQHEENAVSGHLKGSDRARDKDHSRREKDEGRGRDRERDEDRFISRGRDRDGRDVDRHSERSRERDREKNRYRDRERDGDRDRDRDKNRDKDRERDKDRDRDRDRDKDPDHGREKGERGRDDRRGAGHRRSPTRAHSAKSASPTSEYETHTQPSPRKINMSSSPVKARTAATAMRNEAVNDHDTENWLDDAGDSLAKMNAAEAALQEKQKSKEKPSFEYSGKLAAETNKVRGVTLRFTEPPEARKPTIRWRLYIFKDGEPLGEPLYIHRLSCYLFGRERRVADVPTDHPSCSKQHAVVQYRLVEKIAADGTTSSEVKPYLMDLGSTNGTFINGERIEPERYYELFEKDTIKFGNSSREYVLLHEHSAG